MRGLSTEVDHLIGSWVVGNQKNGPSRLNRTYIFSKEISFVKLGLTYLRVGSAWEEPNAFHYTQEDNVLGNLNETNSDHNRPWTFIKSDSEDRLNREFSLFFLKALNNNIYIYYLFKVCVNRRSIIRTTHSNYGNVDCSWTLGGNYGYFVVLEVSSLSFGTCSSTCSCGKLGVFDTSTSTKTKIGSWCSPPRKSIVSNGRQMLVRFIAFPASAAQYFQAQYQYEREIQGNNYYSWSHSQKCETVHHYSIIPRSFSNGL